MGTKLQISERKAKEKKEKLLFSFPNESNFDKVKVTNKCENYKRKE